MTSPTEDVYEAAARAGNEANALTDRAILWPDDAWFRAAVDSAYAAGVAAGRAQAAADIRAATVDVTFTGPTNAPEGALPSLMTVERAARIAEGGDPR